MAAEYTHGGSTGLNVHVAHRFEYADAAAREAATGFVAGDAKTLALQLDDHSLWVLADHDPATWVQVGDGGGGGGGGGAGVYATLEKGGTNQTGIATNTYTKVTWPTVGGRSSGLVASGTFTPGRAGQFPIVGQIYLNRSGGGVPSALATGIVLLYKNGARIQERRFTFRSEAGGVAPLHLGFVTDSADSDDYFEIYVWHNAGGDCEINGGAEYTYLAITEAP